MLVPNTQCKLWWNYSCTASLRVCLLHTLSNTDHLQGGALKLCFETQLAGLRFRMLNSMNSATPVQHSTKCLLSATPSGSVTYTGTKPSTKEYRRFSISLRNSLVSGDLSI